MARTKGLCGLGSCLLLAISASAQDVDEILSVGDSVVSRVEAVASTVTPAPDVSSAVSALIASAVSTNDVPLSLFTQGLSLLSSYFPSTTLTGIPSSWPGTIVLGGTTIILSPSEAPTGSAPSTLSTLTSSQTTGTSSNAASSHSPSQTSSLASPTAAAAATNGAGSGSSSHSNGSNDISADKKLGIILGVVLGFIAFAIAGVLFFCLWRRRKDTGSFFVRRTPSTTSSEFRSWRAPGSSNYGNSTSVAAGPFQDRNDRYARLDAAPEHERPAMVAAPGLVRHQSSRSNSDENPFYTPQEYSEPYQGLGAGEMQQVNHNQDYPAYEEVANPGRSRRPPSPFNPLMMATMGGGAGTQSDHQRDYVQDHHDRNPFMSPEDEEADDFISPTIPSRNVERRNSPRIHYPSWNEVSEFDFADGRQQEPYHYSDGGDGWHPVPQGGAYGRHELP